MDVSTFARDHVPQITATIGLVTYASTRRKLTLAGILAGILVAGIHMLHPWPAFFWLLIVFFVLGTGVTKIGHKAKAHVTQSATGGSGGEGARTANQVFANSGTACILIAIHAYLLRTGTPFISSQVPIAAGPYFPVLQRVLPIGIVAQYAAVAADTCSSELGILAKMEPFMITAPWRKVPRGTNGGVTVEGLLYGALGGALLTLVAGAMLYVAPPHVVLDVRTGLLLAASGLAGSVIDSVLGALVQATVTDKRTGKVVEGAGGQRVKVLPDGSRIQLGQDLLTNNGVNFAMAALASVLAMGVAHELGIGM
ncbi:Transmembrane 19 [Lecanosticta acicola]|uniref:Transmembrane 19 n=1 Tax=Lecanosticta acicola TaxID=111012 RepID=A0AAI8YVV4_9PEZI|nr:Transmembrane 19 [Lecanosticta acicola]